MPDFLLEIGTEEIPARMIDAASRELKQRVTDLLKRERLASGEVVAFDTPRRLSVLASGISVSQADLTERVTGPSANIAYKDGQPTPAAHAFAKKAGVDVSKLETVEHPQGRIPRRNDHRRRVAPPARFWPTCCRRKCNSIYWPKNMYWRKPNEKFVRPVRWIVALLDEQIVPHRVRSESRPGTLLAVTGF